MKYRKIMTAIASMTMAGVMLAGCSSNSTSGTSSTGSGSAAGNSTASSGGSESTAGSEKVSLTVWGPQEDQELIKKMCDEFAAANPEKTYTFTYGVVSEADAQKEVNKDISAYNDELMKLDDLELQEFDDLKKIIGQTKAMPKTNPVSYTHLAENSDAYVYT